MNVHKFLRRLNFYIFLIFKSLLLLCVSPPSFSNADESDFKVDATRAFVAVGQKASFNNYEGKLSRRSSRLSEQIYPDQKLFIKFSGEYGGSVIYDGKPLLPKEHIQFNHLLFSPDHNVALAYGLSTNPNQKSKVFFINDQGTIIASEGLAVGMGDAKVWDQGFVILGSDPVADPLAISNKSGGVNYYISNWDFSGRKIWKTELGNIGPVDNLSISPNGEFIIFSSVAKWESGKFREGKTYVFDGSGKALEKFNAQYESFISRDNQTVVMAARKHLMVVDLKNKSVLFKKDLDMDSKAIFHLTRSSPSFYGIDENYHGDEIAVTLGDGHRLDNVLLFDCKNRKVTQLDIGSKDIGSFGIFYSGQENKIVTFPPKTDPKIC